MNWVKQGDLNTAFFCKIANMWNRKNKILRLEAEGGIIEDEDRIRDAIYNHFKNVFGGKSASRWSGYVPATS